MRSFAARFDSIAAPPDTVATLALAGATGEAQDYPSNTDVVRVSASTTAGAAQAVAFNATSTGAVWPSADVAATTATTNLNALIPAGESRVYRIPRGSTGYSAVMGTSGIVTFEFWKVGG